MKSNIGIQCGLGNKLNISGKRFKAILEYNGFNVIEIKQESINFFQGIEEIGYYIFPYVHYDSEVQIADTLLPLAEQVKNVKIFPDWNTRWHYNDKIKGYLLLKKHNFNAIDTKIFWEKEAALNWVKNYNEYPIIFKLKGGASSLNVVKLLDANSAEKIVNKAFSYTGIGSGKIPDSNNLRFGWDILKLFSIRRFIADVRGRLGPQGAFPYWQVYRDQVIFQKYLPNNKYDTRVTVIGNNAFVYRRWNRPDDFRASGSGIIDYDISQIDIRCISMAFQISKKLSFQSMAYDFLLNEYGAPEIVEISYTFVDELVYKCPGYFDEKMDWHEGHVWPQLAILKSLLGDDLLQQPKDLEKIT